MRQRLECHPLMVRHPRLHHGVKLTSGEARRRIVERFIETKLAARAVFLQTGQIVTGFLWGNHQRQQRSVRSDNHIVRQAATQAKARNTKGLILIILLNIKRMVARFRHAPRHAALFAPVYLARYG
ncbi:hypothetical protein D3C71_1074020 [compost metagenome]